MKIAVLATMFVATTSLHAQTVTLDEAVAAALSRNPRIVASDAQTRIAVASLDEATSARLPSVSASQSIVRSDNPVFVFGSLLEQGRFAQQHFDPRFLNDPDPLTNARLALNVRYTIFDQLRRTHAIRRARTAIEQAGGSSEELRQQLRAETIARFYGLLLASAKRDVANEAVRMAEADAAAMRDRYEQGLLVQSELLAAEVQLASFRQRAIEADGDVAIARAALATLMQRPVSVALDASGAIPENSFDETSLDAMLANALARRASIANAQKEASNAELRVADARASRLPRVDAFASIGASAGSFDRIGSDSAIGVQLAIDLFDPARNPRIASAQAAFDATQANVASERDRVTMEVVTAWNRTRVASERIGVAEKAIERADAASRIVRDRYENGLTTITEHLRAQTALITARLEFLAARYDHVVAYAELLRATGGLTNVESFR